jgi:DNA-binding LytR/AlgR family response regulator
MHYIGMSALHASAHMTHAPGWVAASGCVAIAASGLALWLAGGRGGRPPLLMSATAFGVAISGMHYTAMAGVTIFPHANPSSTAPALSSDLLAIVVAIVAFLVSAVFLLTLVPDRSTGDARAEPTADRLPAAQAKPRQEDVPASLVLAADADDIETGRGSYAPLGGAGAPPRRAARHLPVERDGATQFVPVDEVVAIHANAHYTYIFDGTAKLFCPLAIGDVESRLDTARFVRVHRSHIVNIDRIVGLKRAGDGGLIELAAAARYAVPVARSRVGWLKSRMGSRFMEAAQ